MQPTAHGTDPLATIERHLIRIEQVLEPPGHRGNGQFGTRPWIETRTRFDRYRFSGIRGRQESLIVNERHGCCQ